MNELSDGVGRKFEFDASLIGSKYQPTETKTETIQLNFSARRSLTFHWKCRVFKFIFVYQKSFHCQCFSHMTLLLQCYYPAKCVLIQTAKVSTVFIGGEFFKAADSEADGQFKWTDGSVIPSDHKLWSGEARGRGDTKVRLVQSHGGHYMKTGSGTTRRPFICQIEMNKFSVVRIGR